MLLTAFDVLARRQMTERAMRTPVIVIVAPAVEKLLRVGHAHEAVQVQALIPQAAVETLDEGVLHGLTGSNEIKRDPTPIGGVVA